MSKLLDKQALTYQTKDKQCSLVKNWKKAFQMHLQVRVKKKVVIVSPLPAFTMQTNTSTHANCNV